MVLVAFDAEIFDEAVLNGTIMMIAVSCFVAPLVTERYGRKLAIEMEKEAGYDPSEAPQRFLVPMAYAKTSENLLDMTFVVRHHGSEEPVFPLSVVPHDEDTTAHVADAEKMLSEAVVHGSSAEIPVVPLTRVAHNPASGISRAAVERRISDIVVGWQGPGGSNSGTFGRVIDQTLEETEQQMMICHLTEPIATLERVIMVFPPLIQHHQGYRRAVGDVKRLTNAVGALLTGLCLKEDMSRIRDQVDQTEPELASSFVGFNTMEDLVTTLKKRVEDNDLVVFLSARRGTVPWSRELEQLPGRLGEFEDQSMAFLFLTDVELESGDSVGKSKALSSRLDAKRTLVGLKEESEEEAVRRLLETRFEAGDERLEALVSDLGGKDSGFSRELHNEVLSLNARTEAVKRSRVFVATMAQDVDSPSEPGERIRAVTIVLSPQDTSLQEHLDIFKSVTDLVSRVDDMDALTAVDDKFTLVEELRRLADDESARYPAKE